MRLKSIFLWGFLFLAMFLNVSIAFAGAHDSSTLKSKDFVIHHDLQVKIKPQQHFITVEDNIRFSNWPTGVNKKLQLALHKNLKLSSSTSGVKLKQLEHSLAQTYGVPIQLYELELPVRLNQQKVNQLQLKYEGKINHALPAQRVERSQGFRSSAGLIEAQGVYLSGSSYWYPRFNTAWSNAERLSFKLQVTLPENWQAVSQGELEEKPGQPQRWHSAIAQNEIYLLAAPFVKYTKQAASGITAMAYLRSKDDALAERYLAATEDYIQMYNALLGDYPFKKFALVENFWETGFGMPSFTLLGSRVIRFPFILYTSYPHEILHNWWGNGVYVDYSQGNWSEGLTAYLADHLLKEQRGKGADYRQQLLQKYTDYIAQGGDFALSDFRSRHSSVTEAVGYGKTLMLFHMLRLKLGDAAFLQGLRQLYQDFQFQMASYADVQQTFEQVSAQDLKVFFQQWVKRIGAPQLAVEKVSLSQAGNVYVLKLRLKQKQAETYALDIPLAITLKGQKSATQIKLSLQQKQQDFQLEFQSEPLRIDIDPQFDLFRSLSRDEIPTALTQLFAAVKITVVLPSQSVDKLAAYKSFAEKLFKPEQQLEFILDSEILDAAANLEQFNDTALVLLGWDNRLVTKFPKIQQHRVDHNLAVLQKQIVKRQQHSLVITRSNALHPEQSITWISSDTLASLPGLARKLPHYHKYSYLSFTGDQPTIQVKGRWPVNQSSMTIVLKGGERGELTKLVPLTESAKSIKN